MRAARRGVSSATDALVAVIVAPECAACGVLLERPTSGPVCDACWNSIEPLTPPLCPCCGDPLPAGELAAVAMEVGATRHCPRCRKHPSAIARSRAVGDYSGVLRTLVHLLKYDRRRSLALPLAARMAQAGADVLAGADAVVPVPLHWMRKWRRGFNQAVLLAAGLGVPVWPALARVRATRSQVDLSAHARRANVRGAFAVARRRLPFRQPWRDRLAGKILVLVDDVSTTTATLEACAGALKDAGAREVRALTAARVVGLRL